MYPRRTGPSNPAAGPARCFRLESAIALPSFSPLSRSFLSFVAFLAVLVLGVAALAWWVGPATVSLALDEERRGAPYYLIHLLDAEDASGYFKAFGQLLREEEAQLLWRGGLRALHAGRSRDEMPDVAFIEFAGGGDVVQMLTSATYRRLTAARSPVLLGTPMAPGPIARDEILLLWLLETVEGVEAASLESLTGSAANHGGQLIWSAPVDVLEGDRLWDHVLLLAFPEEGDVQSWLADPHTATDRALARRFFQSDALLELSAG